MPMEKFFAFAPCWGLCHGRFSLIKKTEMRQIL